MSEIGKRLRQLRLPRGQTEKEFAELCGISQSTIHDIETGKTPSPGIAVLIKIIEALKLSPIEAHEFIFGRKLTTDLLDKIESLEKKVERLQEANFDLTDTVKTLKQFLPPASPHTASNMSTQKAGVESEGNKKPAAHKHEAKTGFP